MNILHKTQTIMEKRFQTHALLDKSNHFFLSHFKFADLFLQSSKFLLRSLFLFNITFDHIAKPFRLFC